MRIVVTGATGNVGTSLVDALVSDARVTEIVGLARRRPQLHRPLTTWVQADIVTAPLEDLFRGADAVVHLAWLIQPSRDGAVLEAVNVEGSRRVFEAAAKAGVGALVHASSAPTRPGPTIARSTSHGRRTVRRARSTRATRPRRNGCSTSSKPAIPSCAWCGCARR